MRDAAGLAGHLGRGAGRIATDAVIGDRRRFPRAATDLDPALLTRLMGRTVTAVSVIDGAAGTSSRARLSLAGEGVPASVFVKLPARTATTRLMGELWRLAHTEVLFYERLSPIIRGAPRCYGSAYDPVTGRYVLVLEDLAAAGCEFADTLHPLNPDRAAQIVELLAALHAAFWLRLPTRSGRGALGWVYSNSEDRTSMLTGALLRASARRLAGRTDIAVDAGRFIDEHYRAIARVVDRPPHTVVHGDAHPGNVYFHDGAAGLLDWQAVRRGHPARELAYTLITGMAPEDRRTHEAGLLDGYRRALATHGGPVLDADELWERYRQGAMYAYAAASITAGMGGMQDEGIALEGLRRAVIALGDLDTVAALRAAL
ncbi:DUF1679 domain-containing protein [Mycobacterium sp. PS03-16]|uniref:phosphotransferase n=1 Tax=Mycobacterium sp. PS03-16 TaxID=2559611 RepID=UPI001073B818|nr:phosphotransferase [Mycobacterium sp. PS03-16]TFV56492.1 DUF1679 domain-containing protein [Mycobacterium sp. PS03-16]